MADIRRLLCTGDSLTDKTLRFPNGSDRQADNEVPILVAARGNRNLHWSDILARDLRCEMVNTGIGGFTAKQMLPKLDEMIFRHNPSHVLLNIGNNDLAPWNNFDYKQTMDNIRSIVSQIVNHGIVCYLWTCSCNIPSQYSQARLPMLAQYERELDGIANEFAAQGCKHISIWDYAWGKVPENLKVSDTIHNSIEGNLVVAKKLYTAISSFNK